MKKAISFLLVTVSIFTVIFCCPISSGAASKTHLNKTSAIIYVGKSLSLKLLNSKNVAIDSSNVTWKTSDKKIATVSKKGVVSPIKAGSVKITAVYKNSKYSAAITVKSLSLSKTKASLYIGKKITLQLSDNTKKVIDAEKVNWKSSDAKIAKVSKKGVISGLKAGKVTITAIYKGIAKTASINVKSTVSIDKASLTFKNGSTSRKSVTVTFKGDDGNICWKIIKGTDLIECEWGKDWDGYDIKLYISPTGDGYGKAQVKVSSVNHPNSYAIINVEVQSPYTLKIKNTIPCDITYEDGYDRYRTVSRITKVTSEIVYGDSMKIDVYFTAIKNTSSYDELRFKIPYRIKSSDGYVIESDEVMSESMSVGDKFKDEIYLWDLEPGVYTIEFYDARVTSTLL